MRNFCLDLKEHVTKIINYEKKNKYTTMKKINLIKSKKFVIYAKKDLLLMITIKNIIKSEVIVITLESIEELLMIFVI